MPTSYTVNFEVDGGPARGLINGAPSVDLVVNSGAGAGPFYAVASPGWEFTGWSDGTDENPYFINNVTADRFVRALFSRLSYSLTYIAEQGGYINGQASQTIQHGFAATAVMASPNPGYVFEKWSDGFTNQVREDLNIAADTTLRAFFNPVLEDNGGGGGDNGGSETPASTYCLDADVSRYCTPAGGADIAGAIDAATRVIDAYTGDHFLPAADQVLHLVTNRAGVATFPQTTRTVYSVSDWGSNTAFPENSWDFAPGAKATLRVNYALGPNILIVGREPWNHSARNTANLHLRVVAGTGWATTPAAVRDATAILAAAYLVGTGAATALASLEPALGPAGNITSISVEGFSVSYKENSATTEGTGYPMVDRLLAPYRRAQRTRWS